MPDRGVAGNNLIKQFDAIRGIRSITFMIDRLAMNIYVNGFLSYVIICVRSVLYIGQFNQT